jgi:hypothetical protein
LLCEVERFKFFTPRALSTVDEVCNLLALLDFAATVQFDKVVDRQVASANSDHNGLSLNLHEDSLPVVSVDSLRLSFEVHLTAEAKWFRVDVVCQGRVDWVFLERLVNEQVVFDFLLQVNDQTVKPLDFVILNANVLQELDASALSFLALLFDLEQVVGALLVVALQVVSLLVQRVDILLQLCDFGFAVFLCTEK